MKHLLLRLMCLLCVISLLPVASLADHGIEEEYDATFSFDYTVDKMDLSLDAFPAEQRKILTGVRDLLAVTSLKGDITLLTNASVIGDMSFRVNMDVEMGGDPDTDTHFELYGVDSHYFLESELLNDQKLVLNNEALLEFALKAYYHLEMPLQYFALLVSPYATTHALETVLWCYNWFIGWPLWWNMQDHTEFQLPKGYFQTAAQKMQDEVGSDRAFNTWVSALFLETGYSDLIFEFVDNICDWIDAHVPEDGLWARLDGKGGETWTIGDHVIYAKQTDGDREKIVVDVPDTIENATVHVETTRDGAAWEISALVANEEHTLLEIELKTTALPNDLPFEGDVKAELHVAGDMLPMTIDVGLGAVSAGDAYTITLTDPLAEKDMIVLSGTWKDKRPQKISPYHPWVLTEINALNIFSVNDTTLPEFINSVKGTIVRGALKLAREIPASSFQSLFDLLDEYNILDVLTGGLD